jgi:hypothetical protein
MHLLLIDDNPKSSAELTSLLESCPEVSRVYHGVNAAVGARNELSNF